jgi:hypothetical protein
MPAFTRIADFFGALPACIEGITLDRIGDHSRNAEENIRMERLLAREKERYGDRIMPGGDMHEIHVAFHQWASRYDDPTFSGRNRARHEAWLSGQMIPVIRLDGTHEVDNLAMTVTEALTKV